MKGAWSPRGHGFFCPAGEYDAKGIPRYSAYDGKIAAR
jgi:hypothetical protein